MKVICSLCEREGKPGYLGEREPLDNPEVTHGLCSPHTEQLLESIPSRSFPDAELLLVVRPNDTELYEYLQRSFAGVHHVKVIVERRGGGSPSGAGPRHARPAAATTADSTGQGLSAWLHRGALQAEVVFPATRIAVLSAIRRCGGSVRRVSRTNARCCVARGSSEHRCRAGPGEGSRPKKR